MQGAAHLRRAVPAMLVLVSGICLGAVPEPTLDQVRSDLKKLAVDPQQTFRVRELQFSRGGVKFYLTEGVLAFATPVCGQRVAAIFSTQLVEAGDAEMLALPPDRAERASLASFTGSPNLDEHFTSALLFFADGTGEELLKQMQTRPLRPVPEAGAKLAEAGDSALRSNAALIDVRLTASLLDQHPSDRGFFYAMIGGRQVGAFDFSYLPDDPDPVTFGRMAQNSSGEAAYFQIWASYRPRGAAALVRFPSIYDYRIDVNIKSDLSLAAEARFDYLAREGQGRVIPLLLTSRLQVQSATVDGQPAEICQHASALTQISGGSAPFLIVAPAPLPTGSHHQIQVEYGGNIIHKTAQGTYFVDDRSAWFPYLNPLRASFDLMFHCPEHFQLVATGEPVSEEVKDGTRTIHRRTTTPEALAGFNMGEYTVQRSVHGPYAIEVYTNLSASLAPANISSQTASILDRYTKQWGPLPIHTLAVSPIEGYFGQGFPGLIYLSDITYTRERNRPASLRNPRLDSFFTEMLLPHEVAHQWWGNIVAPADYRSTWILEAMSNYVALQYLESSKGRGVFDELLSTFRGQLAGMENGKSVDASGPVVFGERLLDNYGAGTWHDVVYDKGAWIFHMLRQRLGDAGFSELQHRLLTAYSVKPITNDDLRREAASLLPPGLLDSHLDAFFETWVYGTGFPALSLNGQELTVSEVDEDYLVDIPLNCQAIEGKGTKRWLHVGSGENSVPWHGCRLPSHAEFLYR